MGRVGVEDGDEQVHVAETLEMASRSVGYLRAGISQRPCSSSSAMAAAIGWPVWSS